MLQAVLPEDAKRVAAAVRGDERRKLRLRIGSLLFPMNADQVFSGAWTLLIAGDEAGARKLLDDAKARGIPMPL